MKENKEVWEEVYKKFEAKNAVVNNHLNTEISLIFKKYLKKNSSLLEAGSGSGSISALLSKKSFNVSLLDQADNALKSAKKVFSLAKEKGKFIKGDLFDMPFKNDTFDCVWNSGVMEHFDEKEIIEGLKEMGRVSKDMVITLVPYAGSIFYRISKNELEINNKWEYGNENPKYTMSNYFKEAGLNVVEERLVGLRDGIEWLNRITNDKEVVQKIINFSNLGKEEEIISEKTFGYLLVTIGSKKITKSQKVNQDLLLIQEQKEKINVLVDQKSEKEQEIERLRVENSDYRIKLNNIYRSWLWPIFRIVNVISHPKKIASRLSLMFKKKVKDKSLDPQGIKIKQRPMVSLGDVFYFPVIDYDFRFQRPQQIANQFAATGYRVFYFEINFKQVDSIEKVSDSVEIKEIARNIYGVKLVVNKPVNIYTESLSAQNVEYLLESIKTIKEELEVFDPIVVTELPFWLPLVKEMEKSILVYDCMDLHSGFDTNTKEMVKQENELIRVSDRVIVTSEYLYNIAKKINKNTFLVRNACDFGHFHGAVANKKIGEYKKPVIGYYGAISSWFDDKIVQEIAESRPDWEIVLIGNTFGSDVERLEEYDNVHLLGEKPYNEIPNYLAGFDICIIPFKINELTKATDPVKFYEMMAAEKTVVSTNLPELKPFSSFVKFGKNGKEFVKIIEGSLKTKEKGQERSEFAKENTWESRFTQFERVIVDALPKISVIVLAYNQLEYTKICIQSILENTNYPNYELVIVDNASTDETPNYLKEISEKYSDIIKPFTVKKNRGFAGGNNYGAKKAEGDYLIFLNNDTYVTPSWANKLVSKLRSLPNAGMVGPVTNSIGNEAMIDVQYESLSEMLGISHAYTKKQANKFFEISVLAFFCVAIKRDLYEKVGGLDERYKFGTFEDDDFCKSLKNLGYNEYCLEDVFVHHFGSVTLKSIEDKEFNKIFYKNKKAFEEKWGENWAPHKRREEGSVNESA